MKALTSSGLAEMAAALGTSPAVPRRLVAANSNSPSLDELRSLLPYLPIDDARGNGSIDLEGSDNWLGVTWALRREYGDEAKELYREQCKQSRRYEEAGFEKDWAAYDPDHSNPITIKSVYTLAKSRGWKKPSPQPSVERYKLLNGTAINALAPLEWLIKGWLPLKGLAAIYGPSASGKSFVAIDIALSIARGKPWFGKRVKKRTVIYVTLEGEAGLQSRLQAWQRRTGEDLPQDFFAILQPLNLLDQNDVIDLIAALPKQCVVIIDTLNRAAPGADENSGVDMGNIIAALKQISEAADALVIPIHHTGKDQSKGLRGHSSLFAALDGAIEVERTIHGRTFRAAKVKDGNDGDKTGFRLDVIALGLDSDGDPMTSCVVTPDDAALTERRTPKGLQQRQVLAAIQPLAPLALEEAITVAGPLVSAEKKRQRNLGRRTVGGLIEAGFLILEGPNDEVSVA